MNAILKTALALAAVGVTTPAVAFVDFDWYANVGKTPWTTAPTVGIVAPTRVGYIWVPGHYEVRGERQAAVAGHFIRDDYAEQLAVYNAPYGVPTLTIYDSQGNATVVSAR